MRLRTVILSSGLALCSLAHAAPPAPAVKAPAGKAAAAAPVAAFKPLALPLKVDAKRARTLAALIKSGALRRRVIRDPLNAVGFLHLAATHTDPEVRAGALLAARRAFTRKGRKGRPKFGKNYTAVVLAGMNDPVPAVRAAAYVATTLPLGHSPDPKVLATLKKAVLTGDAQTRLGASSALQNVADFQIAKPRKGPIKAAIIQTLLDGLKGQPSWLVTSMISQLSRVAYPGIPKTKQLQTLAISKLKDPEPGIRATALVLLARTATKAAGLSAAVEALGLGLKDPSSVVRAAAIEGLVELKNAGAIHALLTMVGDPQPTLLHLKGFKTLNGSDGDVHVLPGRGSRIDEAALFAIRSLTRGSKIAFDFKIFGGKREQKRAKAVADLKAWYARNKAALPKPIIK